MYRNGGASALLSADKQTYTVHEHSVTLKHSLIRPGSHRSLPVLFLPHWPPYYWTLHCFFSLVFPSSINSLMAWSVPWLSVWLSLWQEYGTLFILQPWFLHWASEFHVNVSLASQIKPTSWSSNTVRTDWPTQSSDLKASLDSFIYDGNVLNPSYPTSPIRKYTQKMAQ